MYINYVRRKQNTPVVELISGQIICIVDRYFVLQNLTIPTQKYPCNGGYYSLPGLEHGLCVYNILYCKLLYSTCMLDSEWSDGNAFCLIFFVPEKKVKKQLNALSSIQISSG